MQTGRTWHACSSGLQDEQLENLARQKGEKQVVGC